MCSQSNAVGLMIRGNHVLVFALAIAACSAAVSGCADYADKTVDRSSAIYCTERSSPTSSRDSFLAYTENQLAAFAARGFQEFRNQVQSSELDGYAARRPP